MPLTRQKTVCVFVIQAIAIETIASNLEDTYDTDSRKIHAIGVHPNKFASKLVQNANQPIRITKRTLAHEVGHG